MNYAYFCCLWNELSYRNKLFTDSLRMITFVFFLFGSVWYSFGMKHVSVVLFHVHTLDRKKRFWIFDKAVIFWNLSELRRFSGWELIKCVRSRVRYIFNTSSNWMQKCRRSTSSKWLKILMEIIRIFFLLVACRQRRGCWFFFAVRSISRKINCFICERGNAA